MKQNIRLYLFKKPAECLCVQQVAVYSTVSGKARESFKQRRRTSGTQPSFHSTFRFILSIINSLSALCRVYNNSVYTPYIVHFTSYREPFGIQSVVELYSLYCSIVSTCLLLFFCCLFRKIEGVWENYIFKIQQKKYKSLDNNMDMSSDEAEDWFMESLTL